jgi:hypothetical protein
MVNAWELLLKAKLVKDNDDNRESIYALNKGKIIITPSGNAKTIGTVPAMNRLIETKQIPKSVELNIKLLLNIRDDSVHFIHDDVMLTRTYEQTKNKRSRHSNLEVITHKLGFNNEAHLLHVKSETGLINLLDWYQGA